MALQYLSRHILSCWKATFRCILRLIFNRTQRENMLYQELFSQALANGQTLCDKCRPEAASLLISTSSPNPSPHPRYFHWKLTAHCIQEQVWCEIEPRNNFSLCKNFFHQNVGRGAGEEPSDCQEGVQPSSAAWEPPPLLLNHQSHSDLVPPVMQTWSSIAAWTKACKTHKKQDQCDYFH